MHEVVLSIRDERLPPMILIGKGKTKYSLIFPRRNYGVARELMMQTSFIAYGDMNFSDVRNHNESFYSLNEAMARAFRLKEMTKAYKDLNVVLCRQYEESSGLHIGQTITNSQRYNKRFMATVIGTPEDGVLALLSLTKYFITK